MTWSDFYLICFFVGFGLSALAFLAGTMHLHLPHMHVHHGIHLPNGHGHGGDLPWFNFGTLAAFLAWFGGGAAAVVFWFLAKVLMADEVPLDPADYDMVGVLGRMTISIRPGGTGEVVYSQGGTRHVAGARSEDGAPIPKGSEVIVTRYEKGLAYVRRWEDPAELPELPSE